MTAEAPQNQILALPAGQNALPDILLLQSETWQGMAIVRAIIVSSTKESAGFWSETFNAEGADGLKWAMLFAKERVREHFCERRSATVLASDQPFALRPLEDWEVLSVQRRLGFYPLLERAAATTSGVEFVNLLREKHAAYQVEITKHHVPPPSTMAIGA